ncbi:MAG: hypothetical protein KGJ23_16465 [Euryarchaeota archaeon]|nr:hypothetical protein [Euryarchaeota archaeon]MDE2046753.1 hypothetical protein [Thermoplasmata archaeon]
MNTAILCGERDLAPDADEVQVVRRRKARFLLLAIAGLALDVAIVLLVLYSPGSFPRPFRTFALEGGLAALLVGFLLYSSVGHASFLSTVVVFATAPASTESYIQAAMARRSGESAKETRMDQRITILAGRARTVNRPRGRTVACRVIVSWVDSPQDGLSARRLADETRTRIEGSTPLVESG